MRRKKETFDRFHFRIVCRSGTLCGGSSDDFLSIMLMARDRKIEEQKLLPHSTLRVHLYYHNGNRIPRADIDAAFFALRNKVVLELTLERIAAAKTSRLTTAQRAAGGVGLAACFLVGLASLFFQAGVVAPPEGSIFGTHVIFGDSL